MLTGSVVLFCNPVDQLRRLFDSVRESVCFVDFIVVDNSPTSMLMGLVYEYGFTYIHLPNNPGFGAAHNHAFRQTKNSSVHFIINPDVVFDSSCISKCAQFMEANSDVSCVVPKVYYPDGQLQRLCKLLPTPLNLFSRRFFKALANKLDYDFELRWFDYNYLVDVPYVSGCFMAIRSSSFKKINGFDENFFMYLEDLDLSRRLLALGRVVFNPEIVVIHEFAKQSFKNKKLLFCHIGSALKYFNKWGWFIDRERSEINRETVKRIKNI